ncbi:unnamed protein product [marine sediment metagenome]|uniref:Uncharacterized protein n=1 Tax=marine sediment metagenome TaxID=412755 RepID=X1BCX5_9ZZZZ
MEADDKEKYEEDGKQKEEKYTNFEHLKAKVEVLQKEIELIGAILKQNNLVFTEKTEVSDDLDDETYKKLEEEEE